MADFRIENRTSGSGGSISIGGVVTGGTTGSVLFIGPGATLAQDNANFFWNDTNNFLGIGSNVPLTPFFLKGTNYSGDFTKLQDGSALTATSLVQDTINLNTTNSYVGLYYEGLVDFASDPGARNLQAENVQLNVISSNSTAMTGVNLNGGAHSVSYAGTGGIGPLTGLTGTATNSGSGASGNISSGTFNTTISGTAGTIVSAFGSFSSNTISGASTVTTANGSSSTVTISGAATITSVQGSASTGTVSNASAVVTSLIGASVTGTLSVAATLANVLGANNIAQTTAAANVTTLEGTRSRFVNSGAATIAGARSINITTWGNTVGAGVITNCYGINVGAVTNTGTMTNCYGIRVDSMTGAGTHTNVPYGYYQSASADYNYFAGKTGIGTGATIPLALLYLLSTTEQIRTGYDSSNYWNAITSSTGATVFDGVGSGARFDFSDDLGELTINPLQPVTKPHLRLTPRTNSPTPVVGGLESTGNDLSYTTASSVRKTVTYKEDLVNDKTITERIRISGEEMVFTNVIQTGVKAFINIPYNAAITGVTAFADQTGSIVVDLYKQPYAIFSPTLATYTAAYINKGIAPFNSRWFRTKLGKGKFSSYRKNTFDAHYNRIPFVNWALNPYMTSATPITLSSAASYQDTSMTGWDKNVKAGDVLGFVVNSASTITRLDVSLTLLKA